jgi:hypothetical protein
MVGLGGVRTERVRDYLPNTSRWVAEDRSNPASVTLMEVLPRTPLIQVFDCFNNNLER